MTAAYRLKGLGWFGGCVAVVLGFYLVSLQVAAERKKLDQVNARIGAAERDLRALETEFDTRANMVQLERWNGDTLALSAPTARQFVRDEAQLASLDVNAVGADVQTAALVVPSQPGAVIPSAVPAPQPAMERAAVQMAAAANAAPAVIRTSTIRALEPARPAPAVVAAARQETAARAKVAVAKVRPEAVAMLDRKLLSDTTLGDLLNGAHTEAGRGR